MDNSVKERLKLFLKACDIKAVDFCNVIGVSSGFISGMRESIQPDKLKSIAINYPMLDITWLMTGLGDMLKNSGIMIGSNQGDGNKIEYKNGGDVGVGNTVNVTLPEVGTQKIIRPDGSVELTPVGSNEISDKLQRENEALKEKISHLIDNMQLKDDLIASLRDTIELLRHKR